MKRAGRALALSVLGLLAIAATCRAESAAVAVGSKKFTESVILGELATQTIRHAGLRAEHKRELGGTRVLWSALLAGDIDAYPEYTGTLVQEVFAGQDIADRAALRAALRAAGVRATAPLGFENNYALGMRRAHAQALGIDTISDLASHPALTLGFSNEFMDRGDGWPGLRERYRLPQTDVRGLDHDLAYRGLDQGSIDVIDLYSTDAEIRYYDLKVLRDDRGYFPQYQALLLYREDLAERAPGAVAALERLTGEIPRERMMAMNAQAKLERVPEARVAAGFLAASLGLQSRARSTGALASFWRRTREHLTLVTVSLGAACVLAIPLGVAAARHARLGQIILGATGILQTVPALALLVFMIPLLGIGGPPAVVALFLYSLLPIVRNTYTGLREIPAPIRESAIALGLPYAARLRRVELPMALPHILAGIKTSAVINIGTATLGALIGAGGYGQPILTGIRLDDMGLILQGAVPAAGLALLAQGLFELAERGLVPKGLRL